MANRNSNASAQPPTVELVSQHGQRQSFTQSSIVIGRDASCDLVVNDSHVSGHHARITWDGSHFILEDLGSTNGTYVSGERLSGPRVLRDVCLIGIGSNVRLGFQVGAPAVGGRPSVSPETQSIGGGIAPAAAAPQRVRRRRSRLLIPGAILLALACILALVAAVGYRQLRAEPVTGPIVLIRSPEHGAELTVGQAVTIHAVARGDEKVTRLELWIDGELYEVQRSALAGGSSPLPLVAQWDPASMGNHTLTARAFDTQDARGQASVTVEAVDRGDGDGDGVADAVDACPDAPGSAAAAGCPDQDRDGIRDGEDACPDEAGLPESDGCPMPGDGDRDGDGLLDVADACPDEAGSPRVEGCPDADADGVPDDADACPEEPGWPEYDGCRGPSDRDGDGLPDEADDCPDQPGAPSAEGCPDADGDAIRDADDVCPDEPGAREGAEGDGCPVPGGGDRDGDGVADDADACPDEAGPSGAGGCPDRDGDGVGDGVDGCPDEPGAPANSGCPAPEDGTGDGGSRDEEGAGPGDEGVPGGEEAPGVAGDAPGDSGAGDGDGDGVHDDVDPCPDEPGLPEHDGCLPPGAEDEDGDGIPDDEEPPVGAWDGLVVQILEVFRAPQRMMPVEVQVLEFGVDHNYTEVHCYASLAGSDVELVGPFEPLGARQWDIAADLGSRHIVVPEGEPLELQAECGGLVIEPGPEGGLGTYYDLGSFQASHDEVDWDGHMIVARSGGGHTGHSFEVAYRICAGTCEDAAFPPPSLSLFSISGDAQLIWMWGGDRDHIDGFRVYVDGSYAFSTPADRSSVSVDHFRPLCGSEGREFHVTAFLGDRESPPSNTVVRHGQPCPRTVRVTFDELRTFDLQDERRMDGRLGPVFGDFWANGSSDASLPFNASDYPDGWLLSPNRTYSVQSLFDSIVATASSCRGGGCPLYSAPAVNYVNVELGPYDDLSVGGAIYDQDYSQYQRIFNGAHTVEAGEITPGRYTVRDQQIELTFWLDVIVGPEAGELPDLTISDVTAHEASGQLRIHVFNNAADLVERDIVVGLERISSNEMLDSITWQRVTIPSGGERILQSADLTMAPSDLRVTVDWDGSIDEMNEENNAFETPALMRVEFVELWSVTPCESWLNCDFEHWFMVMAGHGTSSSDVRWVGEARYPESGNAFQYRECHWGDHGIERGSHWNLTGQPRYTFEFEMPADHNLYIRAYGYEEDVFDDDYQGYIFEVYSPRRNHGHSPDLYEAASTGYEECDDGGTPITPGGWDNLGFSAKWRITKLQ